MDDEIGINIREFDATVEQAYRTLFPNDPDKSADLLSWRSRRNPHGPTRFVVATRGDEPVGMIALIATLLRDGSDRRLAYQAVDTAVHPSCRGKGLFVKMGKVAQDPAMLGGEVLWGFPNANAAPGWFGRLGWTNFGPVPLLIRPLRSSFLLGRVHPKLALLDVPLVRQRGSPAKPYDAGDQLAADVDALWEQIAPRLGTVVDRTGEWMRWRLMDKPRTNYRCVGLKSDAGELRAFVASKVARKHGSRICYLMEALAPPETSADLVSLICAEVSTAAREGAEAALAWCPKTAPNYRAYRSAGFLPFPARLRPIEIHFGARSLLIESAAATDPAAHWYISFLDSDTN